MSLLTQLRQRLKATQATQKTTNAMRLIAMASHGRLQATKVSLDLYKQEVNRILTTLIPQQEPKRSLEPEEPSIPREELLVIVGSQKGLCGSFNTSLATYFKNHKPDSSIEYDILVIGKQMKETLLYQEIGPALSYDRFSVHEITSLTDELASFVLSPLYDAVVIYATRPKTFFMHAHERVTFTRDMFQLPAPNHDDTAFQNLIMEQSYEETVHVLGLLALRAHIESILVDSLLAEASSRFLSMDMATRNADDMIASMELNYNKLRQASITRELTDLIGGFVQ